MDRSLKDYIDPRWRELLEDEFEKPYFQKIESFLITNKNRYYPPIDQIFAFTEFLPLEETKVVILGQDPYIYQGQAMGLAFSVPPGKRVPPSLENIYLELQSDIDGFEIPLHGDLSEWARSGVLLLDDVLTVGRNGLESHANIGWKDFTKKILQLVNDMCSNVVFMLWGKAAQSIATNIEINEEKHLILKCGHPSSRNEWNNFLGCKHFSQANKFLTDHGKTPIDWSSINRCSLEDHIDPRWRELLTDELEKDYFKNVKRILGLQRGHYYPPIEHIFTFTKFLPLEETKVVILGEYPYRFGNKAMGLAFSVRPKMNAPSSLRNIYNELKTDIEGFEEPWHGDLSQWAECGVLLLNDVLTVTKPMSNVSQDPNIGWREFTTAILKLINNECSNVVFMLWGDNARNKATNIIFNNNHLVLQCGDPCPYIRKGDFIGCKHFSQANEFLENHGKRPIDWSNVNQLNVDNSCSLDEYIDTRWKRLLQDEIEKPYFENIKSFLNENKNNFYPPIDQIFTFTNFLPLEKTKVVILAEGPHIYPGEAMGLAFSVPSGKRVPPSLKNIYRELEADIEGFETPSHGDLSKWAECGVLLLNDVLTVAKPVSSVSHANIGWTDFTTAILQLICNECSNVVFMLWGERAQETFGNVELSGSHLVLQCGHPSPYCENSDFIGCKHFSQANTFLQEHGKTAVDWASIGNQDGEQELNIA